MKSFYKFGFFILVLLASVKLHGQHRSKIAVELNSEKKILIIKQEITFFNESNDTLTTLVLNDWNNSFSNKNTP